MTTNLSHSELKEFLDLKVETYNTSSFLDSDPIQIPHQYSNKEDIEISAFLVATIAWGNRKSIITNGYKLMRLLDNAPFDFIINHKDSDLKTLNGFVHRTFNSQDLVQFIKSIRHVFL